MLVWLNDLSWLSYHFTQGANGVFQGKVGDVFLVVKVADKGPVPLTICQTGGILWMWPAKFGGKVCVFRVVEPTVPRCDVVSAIRVCNAKVPVQRDNVPHVPLIVEQGGDFSWQEITGPGFPAPPLKGGSDDA
jgi:hypothetical protein